ncbi:sugar phosphate isomerase/epimerase family protein [Microbacterium sp. NPDC055910]|uniref:sugar phosphate isomerase/epimerase family protein n=1 Tax=Microbacterium sp. NPDC055910 TaxID=3345659 RepID=UPI0035D78AE0
MKLAYEANAWGGVVGTPSSVTDLPTGFYLTPGEIGPTLEAIARNGFSGVELFDGNLLAVESHLGGFRKALSDNGLELAGVYSGGHFIYRDAHEDEYARFERSIALAANAGARHYVIGGGAIRSTGRRDDDFLVMGELLDRVADKARSEGLVPSYHPHLGSLAETGAQVDALFAASDIGLCADVAHLAAGGSDPAEIIRRYADRLDYVHLKDADLTAGGFLPLGAGDVDLASVVEAVRAAGYDDWITVELDGYDGDLNAAAATSRAFLTEHGLAD